ncbi:hypothetical protein EK21DRAFT_64237, partial [Setomelanomma holmii]
LLTILCSLIASATAADVPSCTRKGSFDTFNANATKFLLQPPLKLDGNRCANVCRLLPGYGSFASTAQNLPTDTCLIFNQDATYDSIFGGPEKLLNESEGLPVGFWEAACFRPSTLVGQPLETGGRD